MTDTAPSQAAIKSLYNSALPIAKSLVTDLIGAGAGEYEVDEVAAAMARFAASRLSRAEAAIAELRKEAAIAWSVCASVHREFAKGRDPFFKTRQADFVKHENDARAAYRSEKEQK